VGPLLSRGRVRHGRFRRRPVVRLAATVLLAVAAGALAASAVGRAEAARAAYGTTVAVPVARHDLAAGRVVAAADVEWRDLPVGVVPAGAATEPVGRVVRDAVVAGEVVLQVRLGGAGTGATALLRSGQRAVAVPIDDRSLRVSVGDRVDVLAPDDLTGTGGAASSSGAVRVARNAEVLAVDELTVTLGVLAGEAPGVSRAVLDGAVALALVGPPP
jgi:Flp pilus assembly protein CpaB